MSASGDIFEVIDEQKLYGQTILNVYFYKQAAVVLTGDVPQQIADTFETNVIPAVAALQTGDILHTAIHVRNLFNPAENTTSLISIPGSKYAAAADTAPSFNSLGMRLKQDNGAIKNGSKRYSAFSVNDATDGVVTDATLITNLLALGAELITGQPIGIIANAILPIIVKRILDSGEYRLPATSGEAVIGNVTDALYNAQVTSQTSRKVGVGE